MNKGKQKGDTRKLAVLAIFTALIIVLQVFSTFVHFGPVSITLALTPIIIGGALYGRKVGAYLGFVFGAVTLVAGLLGWDGGFVMLLASQSIVWAILICLVKATAAGWAAGLVYECVAKKSERGAVIASCVACPVVNTGVFMLFMLTVFRPVLESLAGGADILYFLIVVVVGFNFFIELAVNLVLASGITRIIKARRNMY